jgi:hypothetical protein
MHLLDWLGRSRVTSGIVTARPPARRTVARVVPRRVAATVPPVFQEVASTASEQAPASGFGQLPAAGSARPTPRDLRRLIFAAVASNDPERLAIIFRDNPADAVERAVDWMKVPDELRPNPEAVRWYSEGLRAVAQYCADRLNRPDLFQRLEELGLAPASVQ